MKLYAIFVAPDHPTTGEPEPDDGTIEFYWADDDDHAVEQALDANEGLNVYTLSVRVTPYTVECPY